MAIDARFAEQAQTFITETMKQVIPDANVDGGSGINTVLARGGATITASVLQEIEHMLTTRDLSQPAALSEADMDLLLNNLIVSRGAGDLAFGYLNIYYADRIRRDLPAGLMATIESRELNFLTLADAVYRPEDYFIDNDTGEYYLKVPFASEQAGDQYNVDVGEVNTLLNDTSGALRVYNPSIFRNGNPKQTNEQALRSAQRAVSTRTALTRDGSVYWMQELFAAALRDMLTIGTGDVEMLRDEIYDLGVGVDPRFRIGVASLNPITRAQLGTAQSLHVGGRTDLYLLFDGINYVQQHVDLFADMTLDLPITPASTSLQATFVTGTTGDVAAAGKLIIDLGQENEEVLYYGTPPTTPDQNTYTFTGLASAPVNNHAASASVKVVNNGELTIGLEGDIAILPVFQVADVRLLDPITLQPVGDSLPETTAASREPGWYIAKTNRYDLLSARETKSLILAEKRDIASNQAMDGDATGTAAPYATDYTRYTHTTSDFTGYQGRKIFLGAETIARTILQVLDTTSIVVDGTPLTASNVSFIIDRYFADYIEYPVRVSFYTNTEMGEAQNFLDNDAQRIISGDYIARAFMPVFLDFTLRYRGDGDVTSVRENINEMLKTSSGDAIGESTGSQFEYSDLIAAAYQNGAATYVETPFEVRVRRLQVDGSWLINYLNPSANTLNKLAVRVAAIPTTDYFATDGGTTLGTSTFTSAGAHTFDINDEGRRIWIAGVGLTTIISYVTSNEVTVDVTFTAATPTPVDWSFVAFFLETKRPTSIAEFTIPTTGKLYLGAFTDNQEIVEYDVRVLNGDNQIFIFSEGQYMHLPHAVNEPLRVAASDYDDANLITNGVITDERVYRPFLGNAVIEKLP
jgi:hypothetical protein